MEIDEPSRSIRYIVLPKQIPPGTKIFRRERREERREERSGRVSYVIEFTGRFLATILGGQGEPVRYSELRVYEPPVPASLLPNN